MTKIKEEKIQITCPSCNSRRLQLLLITIGNCETSLELVCMDCGTVMDVAVSGTIETTTPQAKHKCNSKSYLG